MRNIVNCTFGTSAFVTTKSLFQYDHGIKLNLSGVSLPASYEVHFAESETATSTKAVACSSNLVAIPDEFLETGKPVYAWIYVSEGQNDGETIYRIKIPVIARPPFEKAIAIDDPTIPSSDI